MFSVWSVAYVKITNSTRMGGIALFTCFIVAFVILTYFATVHRGIGRVGNQLAQPFGRGQKTRLPPVRRSRGRSPVV